MMINGLEKVPSILQNQKSITDNGAFWITKITAVCSFTGSRILFTPVLH
jgi:hypothetical protein